MPKIGIAVLVSEAQEILRLATAEMGGLAHHVLALLKSLRIALFLQGFGGDCEHGGPIFGLRGSVNEVARFLGIRRNILPRREKLPIREHSRRKFLRGQLLKYFNGPFFFLGIPL